MTKIKKVKVNTITNPHRAVAYVLHRLIDTIAHGDMRGFQVSMAHDMISDLLERDVVLPTKNSKKKSKKIKK